MRLLVTMGSSVTPRFGGFVRWMASAAVLLIVSCGGSTGDGLRGIDSVIPMTIHGRHVVVEVRINDEPARFLLDTGASHNVVSSSLAKRGLVIGLDQSDGPGDFCMATAARGRPSRRAVARCPRQAQVCHPDTGGSALTTRSFTATAVLAAVASASLATLSGCADLRWDRAMYQGLKFREENCVITQRPDAVPCATLPNRDRYERERTALKPSMEEATEN